MAVYKLEGRSNKLLWCGKSCHSWRLVMLIIFFVYRVHIISNTRVRSVSKYTLKDWCSLVYVWWCRCSMQFVMLKMNCTLNQRSDAVSKFSTWKLNLFFFFKEALIFQRGVKYGTKF